MALALAFASMLGFGESTQAQTAAFNRMDMPTAIAFWERLQKKLPPDSEDAKWVQNQIGRAHV